MIKDIEVFSRPPSKSSHEKYSQRYQAFMGALCTQKAIEAGVHKSLTTKLGKEYFGANYLLRTGETKGFDDRVMHLATANGLRTTCRPGYPCAGARIEFNLRYDPKSPILSEPLTQTTKIIDPDKLQKSKENQVYLDKKREEFLKRETEIKELGREISRLIDQPQDTEEFNDYVQDLIYKKIKMMNALKRDRNGFESEKRLFMKMDITSEVTSTLPVIMFGGKPCIWLNQPEILKKEEETMLCWSLKILDCAIPVDRKDNNNDYGQAIETQTQYHNLLKQGCTQEEWAMVVPVRLSQEDGYEKATPILDRKVEEPQAE